MNVEIQKSLHPHISAFDIVVDGVVWGTVHRIINPDTAKAEQEARERQLAAAAALEERMKKLRTRAEAYFRRFQVYASPIMIEALAKEFVAVINAGL